MQLIPPLSTPQGARSREALPEPTQALCGDQGVYMAVGHPGNYLVYRGVWDERNQAGSWQFAYHHFDMR